MDDIDRVCSVCECDFFIKGKDAEFFESQGLELPKRCWNCRKNKRHHKYTVARNAIKRHRNFVSYEEFFLGENE